MNKNGNAKSLREKIGTLCINPILALRQMFIIIAR